MMDGWRRLQVVVLVGLFAQIGLTGPPLATVRNGTYQGVYAPTFHQDYFLGMPYAQDAGGENRFRIPQALNSSWNGHKPATVYGNACPDANPAADAIWGMSENCLNINVVRPAGADKKARLPVMFWIHGGSYQVGSSGLPRYNLSYIVQRSVEIGRPVLAASINYRKGGWGNMYSIEIQGTGNTNIALRDMRKALAWTQENIEAFGGDPKQVTIWGESSGSFAVGQLLMSYGGRTDGLFQKSIQESGSAATAWYNGTEWYQPIYDKIVRQVNCSEAIDTLACLRSVPYETLYPFMNSSAVVGPGFYPTVDGDIIPNYPTELLRQGRFAHIPHIYGTNSDEGTDNAPFGINTDAELYTYLLNGTGFGFPPSAVRSIMELYPDDPAQGVPINTGNERFVDKGWQYKRVAAIVGDVFYHGPRLHDARHYAKGRPNDTFVYRFNNRGFVATRNASVAGASCIGDICGTLTPAYKGATHALELAFVFNNPSYTGPWPDYRELGQMMSAMWINFAHSGDPKGPGVDVDWPAYLSRGPEGANIVLQAKREGQVYIEADTYRLKGREYLTTWARRRHV